MSILRRAEIDMTGYNVGTDVAMAGEIAIRWAKLTYVDDQLVARGNHRLTLNPEDDITAALSMVKEHLSAEGYTWDTQEGDEVLVRSLADHLWTDEVRSARQALIENHAYVTATG